MVRLRALTIAFVLALTMLASLAADASAQQVARVGVTMSPSRIGSRDLAGCPANGPCAPLERDTTYTTSVTLTVDADSDPLFMDIESGGLDIIATADGDESTPSMLANETQLIDIAITIPAASGRSDRLFYYARIKFVDSEGTVVAVLPIVATLPNAKVTFNPVRDPVTNEVPNLTAVVGAGQSFSRDFQIGSNINLNNFELRSNAADATTFTNVPGAIAMGASANVRVTYEAPFVTRRTRFNLDVRPRDGLQLLSGLLRIRVTIQPLRIKWDPPIIRRNLVLQTQRPERVTVQLKSNFDVDNVDVRTVDLGLMPVISPITPINLRANEPATVVFSICPGYAATRYYMSMAVYRNGQPLQKLLPIRAIVTDNGQGDIPTDAPTCQGV